MHVRAHGQQEDLAAQVAQLKAQSAQTNELLTQLAQSAAQRNILELMSAKAAGRSAAELKAMGFSAAALKAAGYSAAELKAAGIFTTKSELQAALTGDTSDIENWDVSLIDDFSYLVSVATPRAWPPLARSCRRAATSECM